MPVAPGFILLSVRSFICLFLFYLLSLFLIVALVPWTDLIGKDATSPFVTVMKIVGIPYADSILNFIVIVAALSAMNSMLYISTRMLFSLSRAGDAPQILGLQHQPAHIKTH